jgi:hypothetical protein
MTPELNIAVEEIQRAFPENSITIKEEVNGDLYMVISDLEIGEQYTPKTSWLGFKLTFQYPFADVYPHYIDGNIRRSDGASFGEGIHLNQTFAGLPDRSSIMLSRRSNRWNPATDTAALKLIKVLDWIRHL